MDVEPIEQCCRCGAPVLGAHQREVCARCGKTICRNCWDLIGQCGAAPRQSPSVKAR